MELPLTTNGNKYATVFQDLFTKWPMVYATPDQKAERIAKLLTQEIVPMFGVPEALLSDRGTNLLSHLMQDVCKMLGIKKLNTTSHHPQCNGMIERFNRTLKTMLGSTCLSLEFNTCMEYCELIVMCLTPQQERSLPFYCMALIAIIQQKLLYYYPKP